MDAIQPLRSGTRVTAPSGEAWTHWWVYPALTGVEAARVIESLGLASHERGPGLSYACPPVAIHTARRTLIVQHCGIDE